MLNKIFLIMVVTVFLFCNPAYGAIFTNGGFETGDFTGWSTGSYSGTVTGTVHSDYAYNSSYGTRLYASGASCAIWKYQTVDLTGIDNFTFTYKNVVVSGNAYAKTYVYIDSSCIYTDYNAGDWIIKEIDVSGYSGNHVFYFYCSAGSGTTEVYIDNFDIELPTPSVNYIAWSTFPPDSWAKGNYSRIYLRVPEEQNNFTFWYKTPCTDYTQTPIPKNYLHRYPSYSYVDNTWYYHYWKTCYHAVHGNYSAKLIIDGSDSSETIKYIPYLDLDVDMPDVIVIPVPEVFVDPPQWNVTIPDAYVNVSWLTNYTDFWDGLGESINTTQYATVGLLLIPFDALNTSISGIYGYVDDARGMLQGFDHCALIVRVGWDVIPNEIQTIFIGSAALGIVVFIYHRRT